MRCSCCGKKRNFFESYERIIDSGNEFNLCVDCCKPVYKIRDFANIGDWESMNKYINVTKVRINGTEDENFKNWIERFIDSAISG